jgi:hypothetical protein
MKPVGLWIAGIWCLLRGLSGLYGAVRLFAFLPSHHAIWPHVLFAIIVEGLIWIVFGVGLLRRSNIARLTTVTWCGCAIAWSSYGFAASPSSSAALGLGITYGLGVLINAVIIWYLLRSTTAALFVNNRQRLA